MPAEKYKEIYRQLKEMIVNGKYRFRDMMPSEHRLISMFDCSRNTVRRALKLLEEEGYLQTIHGKGVQVLYLPRYAEEFPFNDVNKIKKLGKGEIKDFTWKLLRFSEGKAEDICPRKDLFEAGIPMFCAERIYYRDNDPIYTDTFYIRRDLLPDLTPQQLNNSIIDYFEQHLIQRLVTTKRRFSLVKANEFDRKYLDLKGFNCVVMLDSYSFNAEGEMVMYVNSHYSPSHYTRYEQLRWN